MSEETSTETIEAPKLEELPLNADNSKQEIIDHLKRVHNVHSYNNQQIAVYAKDTRLTKDELLNYHEQLHKVLDSPERHHLQGGNPERRREDSSRWYLDRPDQEGNSWVYADSAPIPTSDHIHVALPADPEYVGMAAAMQADGEANVPVAGKPLSAAERKILNELIVNDFNGLKAETTAFVNEQWSLQLKELNEEWDKKEKAAAKLLEKASKVKRAQIKAREELVRKQLIAAEALDEKQRDELTVLEEDQEDAWEKIVSEAADDGIDLIQKKRAIPDKDDPKKTVSELYYEAKAVGRDEAITKAKAEVDRQRDQAMVKLDQQRLAAQRRVLVSGVSHDAAKILEGIPSAREMMAAALAGTQLKELN